jgi:hypothetical protein
VHPFRGASSIRVLSLRNVVFYRKTAAEATLLKKYLSYEY